MISRSVLFALTLGWLGPTAAAQELPAPLRESFDAGVRALEAGELATAEAAFRRVLDGGGELAQVRHNLGIVHQRRGEHERAAREFRHAIRLDPERADPRVLLGASLVALGRFDDAVAELRRAVSLDPRHALARLQLARTHERRADWAGAVEQYRALAALDPADAENAYALGRAYLKLSEWCLARLEALDTGEARLQQALGHTYRVQGRADLALRAFGKALEADPSLPEVHLAMAQIHLQQGRLPEARREIESELALIPDSAGALAMARQLTALEARSP